ncbi:hypothetical protein MVES_002647 [Malassezia vespertilionis]|uniref:Rho-GAP domain-containing protein n=2 Tax=Malassezia vespertilionis TaxID=2020962 RepID=A0A2N1JAG5_9BASI|nr:hypothetical protein MVES_002647 [Malassezia vespertilionis]
MGPIQLADEAPHDAETASVHSHALETPAEPLEDAWCPGVRVPSSAESYVSTPVSATVPVLPPVTTEPFSPIESVATPETFAASLFVTPFEDAEASPLQSPLPDTSQSSPSSPLFLPKDDALPHARIPPIAPTKEARASLTSIPRSMSAAEMPALAPGTPVQDAQSEQESMFGTIGKRGMEMMRNLRHRKGHAAWSPRLDTIKTDAKRRSFFVPSLGSFSREASKAPQTPTQVWLDWLESSPASPAPSLYQSATSRTILKGLRPSSVLSNSASMQSLRIPQRVPSRTADAPQPLFGMPLRKAVAISRLDAPIMPDTVASLGAYPPEASDAERPALLHRADAQEKCLPRIVARCMQSLEKWGVEEEGIYRISGRSSHSSRLRALWEIPSVDLNLAEISPADLDVHSVCSVLKMYLRELPECLVPTDVRAEFDKVCAELPVAEQLRVGQADLEARMDALRLSGTNAAEMATQRLSSCMRRIPYSQWYLLREISLHLGLLMDSATVSSTKMPLSNLTLVLAPTLQVSGPMLMTLVQFRDILFSEETRPGTDPVLVHANEVATPPLPPTQNELAAALDAAAQSPLDTSESDTQSLRAQPAVQLASFPALGLGKLVHPEALAEQGSASVVPSPREDVDADRFTDAENDELGTDETMPIPTDGLQ